MPGWLEHTGLSPWRPKEEPSGWAAGRSARDMLVCLREGLGSHPPGSWVFRSPVFLAGESVGVGSRGASPWGQFQEDAPRQLRSGSQGLAGWLPRQLPRRGTVLGPPCPSPGPPA